MTGPPPKADGERHRKTAPERPWRNAPGHGWQYGKVPEPPDDIEPASIEAWRVWFAAWWSSFWTPDDLPGLRQLVRLYNEVEKGEFQRAAELRLTMDGYGVTEKGRQGLRWQPALEPEAKPWQTGPRGRTSTKDRMRIMGIGEAPPNGNGAA